MARDDAGVALTEVVVVMAVSGLLLAGVLGMVFTAAKLLQAAPTDVNPHTFGALAVAVARLEGAVAPSRSCDNPPTALTRGDCLRVRFAPQTPISHNGDAPCWVVTTETGPRLECWRYLSQGELVALQYSPDLTGITSTVTELLRIDAWSADPARDVPLAAGLAEPLVWDTSADPVTVRGCAAIRPDQRLTMTNDKVPFCDGAIGLRDENGDPRSATEGYPLPVLTVTP